MHWTTIITALVLAAISAFLVLIQGWDAPSTFLIVGLVAAAVVLGLLGILFGLAKPQDRRDLMRELLATMRGDLNDLLRWMRIRR